MAWGTQGTKITWNANSIPDSQKQNGGWYDNPDTGYNTQWFSGSAPSSSSSSQSYAEPSIDWDALYKPQMEALNYAETSAQDNATSMEQDVTMQKESQLNKVGLQEQLANEKFQQSETKAGQNKESALNKAVRDYQALQQQGNVRFGGSSSAGRAMGELAQKEYFRNQGEVEQSYANIFGEIDASKRAAYLTFVNTKEEIDMWARTEQNKIKRQLNDQLTSIKLSKAQTEADKTAKRMAVLDRAVQEAKAIKQQKEQNEEALNMWKQQQDYLIANKLVPTYNQNFNTQGYDPTATNVGASNTNVQGGTSNNGQLLNIKWNPNSKNFEENSPFGAYA